jgi:hypothetical protein
MCTLEEDKLVADLEILYFMVVIQNKKKVYLILTSKTSETWAL